MPEKRKGWFKTHLQNFTDDQVKGAQRSLLEQLFEDHYKNRWNIYKVNFFRGIAFGFGSVLGATVVVALVLWVLSWFGGVPVVGNLFHETSQTIQKHRAR